MASSVLGMRKASISFGDGKDGRRGNRRSGDDDLQYQVGYWSLSPNGRRAVGGSSLVIIDGAHTEKCPPPTKEKTGLSKGKVGGATSALRGFVGPIYCTCEPVYPLTGYETQSRASPQNSTRSSVKGERIRALERAEPCFRL